MCLIIESYLDYSIYSSKNWKLIFVVFTSPFLIQGLKSRKNMFFVSMLGKLSLSVVTPMQSSRLNLASHSWIDISKNRESILAKSK